MPGRYQVQFHFGWPDEFWEKLVSQGVLKGWEGVIENEKGSSNWIYFRIDNEDLNFPDFTTSLTKNKEQLHGKYVSFVESTNESMNHELVVHASNTLPALIFTPEAPLNEPITWQSTQVFSHFNT